MAMDEPEIVEESEESVEDDKYALPAEAEHSTSEPVEEEYNFTIDDVELDTFTCLMCCREKYEDETVAFLVQAETSAMVAWSSKGKGKGKGKGSPKYSIGLKPKMILEERKLP